MHRCNASGEAVHAGFVQNINKEMQMKQMIRPFHARSGNRAHFIFGALFALGSIGGFEQRAHAGPSEVIYTPIVDYREWELELKCGVQDWGNRDDGEQSCKFALGYGVAPRWGSELEVEYSRTPGEVGHVEEYEFENIFQITEHGEHWLDAGIFTEIEHNRLDNLDAFTIGPMFQRETEHTQTNLNVYYRRRLSALPTDGDDEGADDGSRNDIAWQAQWKYNLHPEFQPGVQVFGSLGDPAHLHSQELTAGPAFFGVTSLGNGKSLRYNAALLGGFTRDSPDTTLRFQLEYEFH